MTFYIDPFPGGFIAKTIRAVFHFVKFRRSAKKRNTTSIARLKEGAVVTKVVHVRKTTQPDLLEIFRGMEAFEGISVYVHGSWADGTKCAFSDLDDLIIYNPFLYQDPLKRTRLEKWLNIVDGRFTRMDPLQHHGHWLISEDRLAQLDESYMPIAVLREAVCLTGNSVVTASCDSQATVEGTKKNLKSSILEIEALLDLYLKQKISIYQMKALISSLSLLPAYLHQIRGNDVGKRAALRRATEVLGPAGVSVLAWATAIRASWVRATATRRYRAFATIPYIVRNPHFHRALAAKISPRFPYSQFDILSHEVARNFINEISNVE